jgi:hypothetical protein
MERAMTAGSDIASHLFSKTPLLSTESEQDCAALTSQLKQEIEPRGVIEQMYVAYIAALIWEILRLQRCKVAIINSAFSDAVWVIVDRLLGHPGTGTAERKWVDAVSCDWFSKPTARKEVLELLDKFHLDESAIEAEAIRNNFSEIETLDRMLILQELRLNKGLRSIAEYRNSFAKQVREVSNRVIEGDPVIRLKSNRQ